VSSATSPYQFRFRSHTCPYLPTWHLHALTRANRATHTHTAPLAHKVALTDRLAWARRYFYTDQTPLSGRRCTHSVDNMPHIHRPYGPRKDPRTRRTVPIGGLSARHTGIGTGARGQPAACAAHGPAFGADRHSPTSSFTLPSSPTTRLTLAPPQGPTEHVAAS